MIIKLRWLLLFVLLSVMTVAAQDESSSIEDAVNLDEIEADFVGVIDNESPFHEIPFNVRRTGSTIIVDLYRLSGDLDTLLFLVDGSGNIVASNDDRNRESRDSLIRFPQAAAGQYRAIATRYKIDRGDTIGQFALNIDVEEEAGLMLNPPVSRGALIDAGYPEIEPRDRANWTILAYYGGDTNLEPFIINDLNELELGGGSNERVHVVAMLDRHPRHYNDPDPVNWETTRIYEVAGYDGEAPAFGEVAEIKSEPLADLGDINTGSGVSLAQFLVWGIRNYPADNYIVTLASHGAGWQGVITDETAGAEQGLPDATIIPIPEIRGAFQAAIDEAGIEKFALVVNDACYMASIEYYSAISDYFDYSYGSAEIVVNPALDMAVLVDTITRRYSIANFQSIGQDLIDKYIEVDSQLTQLSDVVYLTQTVTDFSKFDPVYEAVEKFALTVNENPNTRITDIAKARSNTYAYSWYSGQDSLIDIGHFMRRVLIETRDDELADAATNVINALDATRLYSNSGSRVADITSYYNIYFPSYREDFNNTYFDYTPLGEWSRMLRNYYNYFTPEPWTGDHDTIAFHAPIAPEIRVTANHPQGVASLANPAQIGVEIVGRNVTYVDVTIDQLQPDGTSIRVSKERLLQDVIENGEFVRLNKFDPGVTQTVIGWDGALPVVTDGTNSYGEYLIITEEIATLEGQYREPGDDNWYNVGITFPRDGGRSERVINRAETTGATAVIEIPVGSEFQTYRRFVNADGREVIEPGNTYIWSEDGLSWQMEPAPSGEYNLGSLVTAFGGSTGFAEARVTIDNENLPADLRASTRVDLGVTFTHPDSWDRLAFFNPPFVWQTRSDDRTQSKTIYLPYPEDQTAEEVLARIAELYPEFEQVGLPEPVTVQGIDGLQIDFIFKLENGDIFDGRGFTTNTGQGGLLLGAEVLRGSDADLDVLYTDLIETTTLFDAIPPFLQYDNSWTFDSGPVAGGQENEFIYPITAEWLANRQEVGRWLRYSPTADENPDTFIATARINVQSQFLADNAALNNLVTGYATEGAERVVITGINTLVAQNHEWGVTSYEAVRDGQAIIGRVYVTSQNNRAYAIWMEAPDDDAAFDIYLDFEITADGARINPADLDTPVDVASDS